MDEKTVSLSASGASSASTARTTVSSTLTRRLRLVLVVLFVLLWVLGHARVASDRESHRRLKHASDVDEHQTVLDRVAETNDWKVPLDVHIMSKCPDALDCLQKLVVPAMSLTVSKVNFTLSYIGTPTDPDDGVACMHGPSECLGNIVELCAAYLHSTDPKIYLGFTLCLSRRYHEIPDRALVHNCALEHGISFDDLNECASRDDGAFGIGLLRDSVRHSTDVGVKTSCTVRLDDKVRCVRDGGAWKDCEGGSSVDDLVGDINNLWNVRNGKTEDDGWVVL